MDLLTFFSLGLLLSLLIVFAIGLLMIFSKNFESKKKKIYAIVLLVISIFNFVFFNVFLSPSFTYELMVVIMLTLFFLIPFIEGLTMLVAKEISKGLRTAFGIWLVLMAVLWVVVLSTSASL